MLPFLNKVIISINHEVCNLFADSLDRDGTAHRVRVDKRSIPFDFQKAVPIAQLVEGST